MKKIILFAMSFLAVSAAWAQQAPTTAPGASTETINADNVPIEEYVPKVIIEGKWGSGPGEFGLINQGPIGVGEKVYKPSSLAVDSKGNIYILDTANNRVQKFDSAGKYALSILVESLKGEIIGYCVGEGKTGYCTDLEPPKPGMKYDTPIMGDLEIEGINIVIDSKDTLYYYLKRTKDGKETGEVWEFKADKLVKKTAVPVGGSINAGQGLVQNDSDDTIWIFNVKNKLSKAIKSHEIKENKSFTRQQRDDRYKNLKPKAKSAKRIPRVYIETLKDGIRVIRD